MTGTITSGPDCIRCHTTAAADLNGDGRSGLIVDFPGFGLWVWYGGSPWALLNPRDVSALAVADVDGME